jgi:capsular exopolysaccharide synthesis family protein
MAQYEVTLRDYWRILRRRKGIVIFTAVLLGFFSFVLATLWQPKPLYKAAAKVQINSLQTTTSLYLESFAFNAGDQMETQEAIITSFPVLKRAGERLGLFAGDDTAQVVLGLQGRIQTSQEGSTNIVAVQATDPDPLVARDLANTVALVYQEYDFEQKNQQAIKQRQFVEGQREKARQALSQAEDEVRLYREGANLVSLDAQASVLLGQINQGERDVVRIGQIIGNIDGMLREIEAEQGLSEKTLQGVSRDQVGDSFMALAQQLNILRLDRDALLVQFTENHPRIQQLQVRINQLIRTMAQELRQRRQALQRDLEGVQFQVNKLRQEYGQLPSQGLALTRLEREMRLRQEVVKVLDEQYQTALIREADKVQTVTLLQRAITPTAPVNPHNPLQRAVMGVILGMVLGVVFAVVAETLDTSIGTIEDVQEYTGAQVVGIIPFIRPEDVESSLRRRGHEIEDEHTLERMAQMVAYFDPQSTLAESYRTLRTNIEFVTVEKGDKTLMITSSTSGEGKSTVSANLAMTIAQLGKRTLLVDCDLRKPQVARLFGLDKEPGLAEVIVGNYQWREVMRTVTDIVTGGMGMEDIMQTQGLSNLHIITSGAVPPNPAELLNSRKMAEFVAEIKEVYDVVLFDTPPVLHVTDAVILGKKIDGALMVYRVGDIPRTSLRRSVNLLKSVEVGLLGVVLNGIRPEVSTDYHDFGYGSYYAYGSQANLGERNLLERLQDYLGKWRLKRKLGLDREEEDYEGDEDREEDEGEETVEDLEPEAEPVGGGRGRKLLTTLLLALTGVGLVWQSGYLTRPLGLIPVFARYNQVPEAPPEAAPVQPLPLTETSTPPPQEAQPGRIIPPRAQELQPPAGLPPQEPVAVQMPRPSATPPKDAPYALRIASYPAASKWSTATLEKLRTAGQEAFLVPIEVGGQSMLRLLSGSYTNWDAAFQQGKQLLEKGLIGEVTIAYLPYAVELQNFPDLRQALEMLKDQGFSSYVQTLPDGRHRLLTGAFESEQEARIFMDKLPRQVSAKRVVRR